jgi:hypothetical protein
MKLSDFQEVILKAMFQFILLTKKFNYDSILEITKELNLKL